MTPAEIFNQLLLDREEAIRRESAATDKGEFDAALDALDKEERAVAA
jgi:hypothetical protein